MTRARSFAALVYTFAVVMLGTTMPTPMYALYATEFGFSVLTTTVVFAIYAGGVLTALIVFGRWSDALGRRPLLLLGVGFSALSAVVFLLADGVPMLLVGRFLSGLSAGVFAGTATTAIIEMAPAGRRDQAPATATVANIGGLGLGPLMAGLAVQYLPAPLHLSFAAHLVALAVAAALVVAVPETVAVQPGARPHLQRLSVPTEIRPLFVRAAVGAVAGFAVLGLFTAVVPGFLAQVIGTGNHAVAGLVVFSIFAASTVAQVLGRTVRTDTALVWGCGLLVAGMELIALALTEESLPLLVLGALVAGAGQGLSFGRAVAAVAAAAPVERRAEVTSTFFVTAYIGISLPVIGVGLAAQTWGLRTAGIVFAAAVGVVAAGATVASAVAAQRSGRSGTSVA